MGKRKQKMLPFMLALCMAVTVLFTGSVPASAAPTITKLAVKSGNISITWKKAAKADKYKVQIYKDGKWKTLKTVAATVTSYADKSAKKEGKTYKYRIAAVVGKKSVVSASKSVKYKKSSAAVKADVPLKETAASPTAENYYTKVFETELYNYKVIRNLPTVYEEAGWNNYCTVAGMLESMNPENIGDQEKGLLDAVTGARKGLTQKISYKDAVWFIWGDNMPVSTPAEELAYTGATQDNSDFKLFLLLYLLDNPAKAKGNIIIVSGGGYESRANTQEGYPVAAKFRKMGLACRYVHPAGSALQK